MRSRNRYLKVSRERYLKARSKKEKAQILDEYCPKPVRAGNKSSGRAAWRAQGIGLSCLKIKDDEFSYH